MDTARPAPPTRLEAFLYWLRLGFVSFGGPAGQIALMHQELVERRRWISEKRFLHALNYCLLLPGPEAIQLAIYISWLLHGVAGAVVAGVLFFLPAFALLALLAALYLAHGDQPLVAALFYGIQPAVVAVVLFAAWRIGKRALAHPALWALAVAAFVAIFAFGVGFPWIVLTAALLGLAGSRIAPAVFRGANTVHGKAGTHAGAAVIDDDTPPPRHARFSPLRLIQTTLVFVMLWAGAMWLIADEPTLALMGQFFTQAAFLTLGGAYAVLPYVYQAAVDTHGWLSGPQMMAGLALGEATPGPLIMIVTWVGYLGGVAKGVAADPMLAGLAGATVATFFTFLPSFWFILAGAPLIESSRNLPAFDAPLTAISAAVVGVIVNLAVFFAWHALWPNASPEAPFAGGFELPAALIALASLVALARFRTGVVTVIAAGGAAGLLLTLVR